MARRARTPDHITGPTPDRPRRARPVTAGALATALVAVLLTAPGARAVHAPEAATGLTSSTPDRVPADRLSQVEETGLLTMTGGKRRNPLRGTWGVYRGTGDQAWAPYERSRGRARQALRHIALNPKARWFGNWTRGWTIQQALGDYIEKSQNGDPDALVQLTIFRMDPWYKASKTRVPTARQIRAYKTWVRDTARVIGNTRTLLVLQPDATFLTTVPRFKLSAGLIRYAARTYGALPRTRVYLETGGWDWPHPHQGGARAAARLLSAMGMRYADGVATNTTHYNATSKDIERVAEIARIFARKGQRISGVINTSSNGNPFEFGHYTGRDPDHAFTCRSRRPAERRRTCVTLGIPPTTDVANPKWGLSRRHRALARRYVDAYLWIGRPWLYRQNNPYLPGRARTLVTSSPWYHGPR